MATPVRRAPRSKASTRTDHRVAGAADGGDERRTRNAERSSGPLSQRAGPRPKRSERGAIDRCVGAELAPRVARGAANVKKTHLRRAYHERGLPPGDSRLPTPDSRLPLDLKVDGYVTDIGEVRVPILLALLAAQLPTLQQPSPTAPAEGTSAPAELVQAAEAAKAQQATKERIAALTREAECSSGSPRRCSTNFAGSTSSATCSAPARCRPARRCSVLEADLASLTSRQARLRSTLEAERPAIAARLRRLQRLGRVGYARIAWNATSARDVGRAARLMNYLAKDDGRRLQAYARTAGELGETEARLTQRREDARALEAEARSRRAAAEAAYTKKQELLASLENESESVSGGSPNSWPPGPGSTPR